MELQKNITNEQPVLLSRIELAKRLGICPRVVSQESLSNRIPFVTLGKSRRYDLKAVLEALGANSK
ncbi:hypothetical protein [Rubritalea profundi]|uniref:DNA-binding protein n=1 Tax=Rubritalea profundi TaxID=1658618 RepID=A0A2S7TYV2_9BACT|nr:hypothetical protein [Rubritalea profundi]PQJ27926.1 hypothetical protein BSZ32_05030 [Rubritalea profundi]